MCAFEIWYPVICLCLHKDTFWFDWFEVSLANTCTANKRQSLPNTQCPWQKAEMTVTEEISFSSFALQFTWLNTREWKHFKKRKKKKVEFADFKLQSCYVWRLNRNKTETVQFARPRVVYINKKISIPHRPAHGGNEALPGRADSAPPPTRLPISGTPWAEDSSETDTQTTRLAMCGKGIKHSWRLPAGCPSWCNYTTDPLWLFINLEDSRFSIHMQQNS